MSLRSPRVSGRDQAALASVEAALLERIEDLSFLRSLNDRLAVATDYPAACRALVDLVWEQRRAHAVAYLSVDPERPRYRLEAWAPAAEGDPRVGLDVPRDLRLVAGLLGSSEPIVLRQEPPPRWLPLPSTGASVPAMGVLVLASTHVRGAPTGALLVYTDDEIGHPEEDCRVLSIAATSAALALDAARKDARGEFLEMLRHDINNPVHAALGFLEMLTDELRGREDTRLLGYASGVVESLKSVADLVANYLDMAAIDRGAPGLYHEDFDLAALTTEVVARLRPAADEKRIALGCRADPLPIRGDRRQLDRVLSNLLSNAIKYTPPSGVVDVRAAAAEGTPSVAVRDTGYGLSAEDLTRLFGKGARFHTNLGIPGTGLGLYLSRAIVEAHGGSIDVVSAPGRGSTFTVRLPDTAR